MVTYLDYNASTPIEPAVLDYMVDIYRNHYGNPNSRMHVYGSDAKSVVQKARKTIAAILKVDEEEVFFTSGSTESSNIAILGLWDYVQKTGKNHFITTAMEHKAVLEPLRQLEKRGCVVDYVRPGQDGRVSVEEILGKVTEQTVLVSVMHVNSETGVIQPVKELAEALKNRGIWFHMDATQSFGKLNEELRQIPYDMLSLSAHKLRGPQGIGALVLREKSGARAAVHPLTYGGGQESRMRPGTVPVALVGGFGLAAELCEKNLREREAKCLAIRQQFFQAIEGLAYRINGDLNYVIPNTINISFVDVKSEGIFVGVKGSYAISSGSACESSRYEASYVLKAMGYDDKRCSEAVRLSWDYDTQVDFSALVEYVRGQQEE